ncbi:MAG: gamma-glutamylcyclotransferase [Betaproteobacteria bacterium]|nr:gamma-glutamylcyclotransferase [Betaproteobacteria bacterium]
MRSPPGCHDPVRLEAERLSAGALDRSLEATLAGRDPHDPLWIFAYGSLMWNPGLAFVAKRVGTLYGFHRNFCLWSRINRGTPQRPGLVLTLEHGGSCRGLAYRLTESTSREELRALWRREMSLGSYQPRWLECHAQSDRFPVLTFIVNRGCSGYAGKLPMEAMVQSLATARGKYGSSAEYLFQTQATLEAHGILDRRVKRIADRVKTHLARGDSIPGHAPPREITR